MSLARIGFLKFLIGVQPLILLAVSGCTPDYPMRQPVEFRPLSAAPSELNGFYLNQSRGPLLWFLLTNDQTSFHWYGPFGEWTNGTWPSTPADLVQIEAVSEHEIRLRRYSAGKETESVTLHSHCADGYFHPDPRTVLLDGMVVVYGFVVQLNRIGIDRNQNLIVDYSGGGIAVFCVLPIAIGMPGMKPAASATFKGISFSALAK